MAYGDGSITQRGKGVWEVAVSFGKDPATGKYRRATKTVHGTKRDAAKVRDQIRHEQESGIKADGRKVTFSEFADEWTEARRTEGRASEKTIRDDRVRLQHLEKVIGDVPLAEIDARTAEAALAKVKNAGLGATSMHKLCQHFKSVMRKAQDYDLILRNPCDRIKPPRLPEPDRRAMDAEQVSRFAACLNREEAEAFRECESKESRQTERGNLFGRSAVRGLSKIGGIELVRIAMATGMRRGELIGLEWGAVNLKKGTVNVVKALKSDGTIGKPKTKSGIRTIHVDGATIGHLAWWKQRQAVLLRTIGIKQGKETPVCCSDVGGVLDTYNFGRWWRAFREQNGFEGWRLHELRHTQATQLLANGADVKTVQTRLGHASASITLNFYAHAVPGNDEKAADLMGEIMAGKQGHEPRILEFKTA